MRVHAIEPGRLQFPDGWTRARGSLGGPTDRTPTVADLVLPSHDAEAAQNIAGCQALKL